MRFGSQQDESDWKQLDRVLVFADESTNKITATWMQCLEKDALKRWRILLLESILIFSWTSSSGLCSFWGSQELGMELWAWIAWDCQEVYVFWGLGPYTGWGAWELWQRWLIWLPPTVPLPCRTKKWRNLTSSLQKRKAEYHLQGTLALSACLYSMFCFRFLREVQVFCEQINAVLRSAKHIRALLFLDILNQKPPRRLAPIEVRFRLSAERFLACTSNFERQFESHVNLDAARCWERDLQIWSRAFAAIGYLLARLASYAIESECFWFDSYCEGFLPTWFVQTCTAIARGLLWPFCLDLPRCCGWHAMHQFPVEFASEKL